MAMYKPCLHTIGQEGMQDVHSIIAFSPSSTFKFKKGSTSAHVIQFPELLTTIKQYQEQRISESKLKGINEKLAVLLVVGKIDKKRVKAKHMQTIKDAKDAKRPVNVKAGTSKNTGRTVCPKCDGQLILKSGRYGKFYRCSNYPGCRYTMKLKADWQGV